MKMMPQQYCLRWKHHHSNVQNMFAQLLEKERFCDVTLYCSPNFATQVPNKDTVEPQNIRGVSLRAHRVVLAACSELLGTLLGAHDTLGEPVLVIDGAEPKHLRALLDYMYTGEMSVHHSQLASLLKTAEELRIKGLTDIRWNNKDEPPDCPQGGIITTTTEKHSPVPKTPECKDIKMECLRERSVERRVDDGANEMKELKAFLRKDDNDADIKEKLNVNGGPPPLIKLPTKDKGSPIKRENSDTDTPSPKRQRIASGNEYTDDDNSYNMKTDREEWQHGNLDISAERVVGWGTVGPTATSVSGGSWSRDNSDEEWADAPADIGSFLHTRLRVDGDNSADEESDEESNQGPGVPGQLSAATASALAAAIASDIKIDMMHATTTNKPASTTKSGSCDPRFGDVVKLNDYLQHGRRPQFWEENYVRRVMEAVRLKELEMKQAAEILGVSYGTLYGRYRDVYGCINRPYSGKLFFDRTARDFWQAKGPSEVLERLQKGEVSLESASQALGVSPNNLAAYLTDFNMVEKGVCEFEPIPIEMDPSLKLKSRAFHSAPAVSTKRRPQPDNKAPNRKVVVVGSLDDEDTIPATVISSHDNKSYTVSATATTATSGSCDQPHLMDGAWSRLISYSERQILSDNKDVLIDSNKVHKNMGIVDVVKDIDTANVVKNIDTAYVIKYIDAANVVKNIDAA